MRSLSFRAVRFTALIPGTVAGIAPALIGWLAPRAPWAPAARQWLGLILLAIGLALYAWTVILFASRGRGTPAPWDPPRKLVTSGPYSISRNPMYVAVLSVILAQALLWPSLWIGVYGIAVFCGFTAFAMVYEEPTLARLFPGEWPEYRRSVPRWIGPVRRPPQA